MCSLLMHNLVFYICTLHQKLSKSPIEPCALIIKIKLVIIDIYFPIKWFRGALKIQIFQKVKTLTDPALPPHPPMDSVTLSFFSYKKSSARPSPHLSTKLSAELFTYF